MSLVFPDHLLYVTFAVCELHGWSLRAYIMRIPLYRWQNEMMFRGRVPVTVGLKAIAFCGRAQGLMCGKSLMTFVLL